MLKFICLDYNSDISQMSRQILSDEPSDPLYHNAPRDSFITEEQPNIALRCLKKVDIFSFIPVPKDDPVSTRQSLAGTAIFFAIFLTYVIYDFFKFVTNNPPIQQSYRSPLDSGIYKLPSFAVAFMAGDVNNETADYNNLFTYSWQSINKSQGGQVNTNLNYDFVRFQNNSNPINFGLLDWMSDSTKQFYYIMRTPTDPLYAQGLLYVSDTNTYVRMKVSYCYNLTSNNTCINNETMAYLSNFGRFFLFVQNIPDDSAISKETSAPNGNNYLLYNFFVLEGFYKRININFAVIKTEILPDYFFRWTPKTTTRLEIENIFEELSVVNYVPNNTDALSFNFQLSPTITNNRITVTTLLDRVSLWGAFWGVLFAVFALLFLSYNRRKFYKKNPQWNKFKNLRSIHDDISVQKKGQE